MIFLHFLLNEFLANCVFYFQNFQSEGIVKHLFKNVKFIFHLPVLPKTEHLPFLFSLSVLPVIPLLISEFQIISIEGGLPYGGKLHLFI